MSIPPRTMFASAGVVLALLAVATPSAAQYPTPANSTVPCGFVVVPPGFATPAFDFEIVARDLANNPIPNAHVLIDFTDCGSDVRPAMTQPPGTTVDCPIRSVFRYTDGQGRAVFRIVGGSSGGTPLPGTGHGCARVYIEGVLVHTPHVAVLDLDGEAGLTIADLSVWLSDLFRYVTPSDYTQRADYDYAASGCFENIGISDLSVWLGAYFAQSAVYGVPLCAP